VTRFTIKETKGEESRQLDFDIFQPKKRGQTYFLANWSTKIRGLEDITGTKSNMQRAHLHRHKNPFAS
jgi:hypothetical protein